MLIFFFPSYECIMLKSSHNIVVIVFSGTDACLLKAKAILNDFDKTLCPFRDLYGGSNLK